MKLNPGPEIDGVDAKVGGSDVDIDEHDLDRDTDVDEVDVDTDKTYSGKLRIVLPAMASTVIRTLRQAKSFSGRGLRALLARWRLISLTVAVVAAIGLAGTSFFVQYRPNQQTDDSAVHAAIAAASNGAVALLTYSPETIDNDVAAGKSYLTGELLRYFTGFSEHFVAPAVRQQGVKASASVLRAAVADIHPNSAVVLIFVHQTTTTKDKPDPVLSTNSVRVTLTKVNGSWLIAKFEPE
jgi:Mce-associated membrane protein